MDRVLLHHQFEENNDFCLIFLFGRCNNIFCYNYYKIHDIKYLVEKVKNIINVSNSNNIIENYLLLKKQVTYRYTKLSDNLSSDEENDDDKISLLKSIYSKEKTINIINYNKSKKSKGIFIDTNY